MAAWIYFPLGDRFRKAKPFQICLRHIWDALWKDRGVQALDPKVSPAVKPFKYAFGIFDAVSPKAKLSLHTPSISRFSSVPQEQFRYAKQFIGTGAELYF